MKESKDFIVYDCVKDSYSIMSKNHLERIEIEFWQHTINWKIYPYTDKLWNELKK